MKILLIVSAFITAFFVSVSAFSEEFGLVERKGESVYLHSSESSLKPNSPVYLLKPRIFLHIQKRVEKESKQASDIMIHSKFSTVYLLQGYKCKSSKHKNKDYSTNAFS